MKIISNRPVVYSSACGCSSSFEGNFDSSNSSHTKEFQAYANSKGAKLTVDGKWGPLTQAEWSKYGKAFRDANKVAATSISKTVAEPTKTEIEAQKKKGKTWDATKRAFVSAKESGLLEGVLGLFKKDAPEPETGINIEYNNDGTEKKPMSTTTKVLIGVGAVAVLGTIIYLATKKK